MSADKRQTNRFVPARRTFFVIDKIYREPGALFDISIGRAHSIILIMGIMILFNIKTKGGGDSNLLPPLYQNNQIIKVN
jgi:hypothetical protein